jgi:hypothetical protein
VSNLQIACLEGRGSRLRDRLLRRHNAFLTVALDLDVVDPKLLTHNLLRRCVLATAPALSPWRAPWLRRALLVVAGRFVRHGRGRVLRPRRARTLN